jgi:protein Mpv17
LYASGFPSIQEEEDSFRKTQEETNNVQQLKLNEMLNMGIALAVVAAVLIQLGTVDGESLRGWTPQEIAYRVPLDNWDAYSLVLDQSPVATKAVSSATVYTIGDVIAQKTEGCSTGELDRPRILRSMLAGLIGHGPLSHYWYHLLENVFGNVLHCTAWWAFFPKIIVDQTIWGPIWNNTYILLLGLMKFQSAPSIWSDMKRTTIPLIISGLKLWPLAHCITYGLIPVENRVLWVDAVEILWVTILATQTSGKGQQQQEPLPAVKEEIAPAGLEDENSLAVESPR